MEAVRQTSYDLGVNVMRNPIVEPDWKEQPMRPWSEVYDEMCCEVGHAYGLNDIREA